MAGAYYVDFLLERYDRNILSELSLYSFEYVRRAFDMVGGRDT